MVVLFRMFGCWPPDIFLFDELLRQWRDTEKEGLGLVQEKRYRHKNKVSELRSLASSSLPHHKDKHRQKCNRILDHMNENAGPYCASRLTQCH